jgi:hypothetical protein
MDVVHDKGNPDNKNVHLETTLIPFLPQNEMGSHAGGTHLERMTGEDVAECFGGLIDVTEMTVGDRHNTYLLQSSFEWGARFGVGQSMHNSYDITKHIFKC